MDTIKRGSVVRVQDEHGIETNVRVGVDIAIEWHRVSESRYVQAERDPRGWENGLELVRENGVWRVQLLSGEHLMVMGELEACAQWAQDYRNEDLSEMAGLSAGRVSSVADRIGGAR